VATFTPTQGRYLAFIHAYTERHGFPPAESEIAAAMCVSAPSVNQMVKTLEKRGLLLRQPGQARALQILIPEDELPPWNKNSKPAKPRPRTPQRPATPQNPPQPPANLYVFSVSLRSGLISERSVGKRVQRDIEIRGDQTLDDLHQAIFEAFERYDEHLYEFQLGKRPFDPKGPNYGVPDPHESGTETGDARTTTIDDLKLEPHRVFGYLFDFGDQWYHQVQLERIERAIPTVTYPRLIKRVGKAPPQYPEE
jgi:hypothetical protein